MTTKIHVYLWFFLLFLPACGGGGSGDDRQTSSTSAINTDIVEYSGIFLGSVVSGVHYRVTLDELVRDGITGSDGTFHYFSRKTAVPSVTFSVGNLILGTFQPSLRDGQKITVFDLVDATDLEAETKAVNIYRLLRSLDNTESLDSIEIAASVHGVLSGMAEKKVAELSPAVFEGALGTVVGTLSTAGYLRSGVAGLVPRAAVKAHIEQTKRQEDASQVGTLTVAVGAETVQADGVRPVVLQAEVRGTNQTPLPGVRVQFQTTTGSLSDTDPYSAVRLTDRFGKASVFLTAPVQPGIAAVLVRAGGWSETKTVTFVAPDRVPPDSSLGMGTASLRFAVDESFLYVQAVGQREQISVTLFVTDGLGNPLNETAMGYAPNANNVRITMQSHPGGGEMLSGVRRLLGAKSGADVETVSDRSSITLRTTAGEAVIHLRSGRLPGVVVLKAELLDQNGTVLTSAVSTPVAIASGPPHTILFSRSSNDGLINLSIFGLGGVYCQMGSVLVTDRYGNAVPDGTTLSLGLVDAILQEGSGKISKDSNRIMDSSGHSFDLATTQVNGAVRQIQVGDRVLIPTDVTPANRSRFVQTMGGADWLDVDSVYKSDAENISYFVGAALRGGAIHGYAEVSNNSSCEPAKLTTGVTRTTGGIAPLRITYPANEETILNGCFEDMTMDTRYGNPRSSQVLAIASTGDASMTTIDKGGFCFHAAAPFSLKAVPDVVGSSTAMVVTLKDASSVPVPFIPVTCTAVTETGSSGKTSVRITPNTGSLTNRHGQAFFYVEVSGEASPVSDSAQIICLAKDARLLVHVRIP